MHSRPALRLALAAVPLWLAACSASTPHTRIAKNPEIFNQLTRHQKERVSEGNIEHGLPKGGVFLAWGRPNIVSDWERNGRPVERWTYLGYRPVYYQTVGMGLGWGWGGGYMSHYSPPYHELYWPGGTTFDWAPYVTSRVEFTDDRVSFWEYRRTRR
jgi:hypothetical protein